MRLIICDPNLTDISGHHFGVDLNIGAEFERRGFEVVIYANTRFGSTSVGNIKIIPLFSETTYGVRSEDSYAGRWDDYLYFNKVIFDELNFIPTNALDEKTIIIFPTVSELHLSGVVNWANAITLKPNAVISVVVFLMLPSGIRLDPAFESNTKVLEELRALFYRLAFRNADEKKVHFYGTGRAHAMEYSELAGHVVKPHPIVTGTQLPQFAPNGKIAKRVGLYFGDAKLDKGVHLVEPTVRQLAASYPSWTFFCHVQTGTAWGKTLQAVESLAAAADEIPNLEVARGHLSSEDYFAALSSCDIIVTPYDPDTYRGKSSGILWEAVHCGKIAVVPERTWLADEAEFWRLKHFTFAGTEPRNIADSIAEAIRSVEAGAVTPISVARNFQNTQNPSRLADVVLADHTIDVVKNYWPITDWVDLTADKFDGQGWYELEPWTDRFFARWMAKESSVAIAIGPARTYKVTVYGFLDLSSSLANLELFIEDTQLSRLNIERNEGSWKAEFLLDGASVVNWDDLKLVLRTSSSMQPDGEWRELALFVNRITIERSFAAAGELLSEIAANRTAGYLIEFGEAENLGRAGQYNISIPFSGVFKTPDGSGPGILRIRVSDPDQSVLLKQMTLLFNGERLPLYSAGEAPSADECFCVIPSSLLYRDPNASLAIEMNTGLKNEIKVDRPVLYLLDEK